MRSRTEVGVAVAVAGCTTDGFCNATCGGGGVSDATRRLRTAPVGVTERMLAFGPLF